MPTSAAPAPPTLGRYHILKHLASGGMAELYLARATGIEGFERYVVVKKILGDHAKDNRFVKMFLDEARLAAQLHHQNIAQVYDCGQEEGTYYFAMEYVHGENVRDLLKKMATLRKQIPIEHVLTVIAGAAAGLHHAHERRGADRQPLGIVHRDVSPSNLLVAYDGAVKVVDFGIAKAASRMTETRSGTLKGKIAYMSPEQCLGKSVDRRSDVFALGIVLYELTTVSRLFKGENDYITMNRIVTGDITPPSKKRPDYPLGLEEIVMKALSLDVADRYQTSGEMLEAIEQLAARERIALSAIGLGRFVRELFGEKPEPWLDVESPADDLGGVEVTRSNVDSGVTGMAGDLPERLPVPVATTRVTTAETPSPRSSSLVFATATSGASATRPARRGLVWGLLAVAAAAAVTVGFALGRRGESSSQGSGIAAPQGSPQGSGVAGPNAQPPGGASPASTEHVSTPGSAPAIGPIGPIGSGGSGAAPSGSGNSSGAPDVGTAPRGSASGGATGGATSPAIGTTTNLRTPITAPGKTKAKGAVGVGRVQVGRTTTKTSAGTSKPPATGSGSGTGTGAAPPVLDPSTLFPPQE